MKKLIIPFFALLLLAACGGEENKMPGHLITGEIANADGEEIVLVSFEGEKERVIDTVLVENGKFEIRTETDSLRQYILLFGQNEMPIIMMLDEESEDVTIKGDLPGIGDNYEITGSEHSNYIKDYLVFLKPFFDVEQKLYMELQAFAPTDTANIQSVIDQLDSISFIQRDYAINQINAHPESPTSWLMLRELFPASGLLRFDVNDLSYFDLVSTSMRKKYPYSEYPDLIDRDIESVKAQIEQMKVPELAAGYGSSIGDFAPEIQMASVDGSAMKLSDLRGQVVLVDFWASWCGPCRQENPNVVRMYNAYKDKGFTILSVSLDEDGDAWKKAINADNLSWPNHVSDLRGWQSSAAVTYGVNSIPAAFLVDVDGKIIGKDLRGAQLEQKLQEVLG